jgi:peptidoglycan/xylan/chitin deacetylase (PgdA/CDA1 family)
MVVSTAVRALALLLAVSSTVMAAPKPHKKAPHAKAPHAAPKAPRPRPTEKTEGTGGISPGSLVGPPELLFTFDDGPAVDKTPKVLDLLDQYHIKAVFFVNGWHFQGTRASDEKAREVLRETLKRGHAVGNHTIHHYFLCGKVYIKRAAEEIEGNASLIEAATGIRPDLFRTPFGAHCPQLSAVLGGLGIRPIGWDIDPQDWKLRDAVKIQSFIENELHNFKAGRRIVLFHDIQPATVAALPKILEFLKKENEAREAKGQPPIKVIDYGYLLPKRPLVPPFFDSLGRILIDSALDRLAPVWPGAHTFLLLPPHSA